MSIAADLFPYFAQQGMTGVTHVAVGLVATSKSDDVTGGCMAMNTPSPLPGNHPTDQQRQRYKYNYGRRNLVSMSEMPSTYASTASINGRR